MIPTLKRVWKYKIVPDMDLLNVRFGFGATTQINDMAKQGWEPHMIIRTEAIGFKTTVMFRKRVWRLCK